MKKVSELTGAELALWVAKANKIETPGNRPLYVASDCLYVESGYGGGEPFAYRPDSRWEHGGYIIEREGIDLECGIGIWRASKGADHCEVGETPLIAAMRCYVASVYGETVDE